MPSKIHEEMFADHILDWVEETARGRNVTGCLIYFEKDAKEPFNVLARDLTQNRWRMVSGPYLRLALERAFDVHFQTEKEQS